MNTQSFAKVFPLGSHLCREPMPPMAELKRDMENLRRHGFNLVKLQEHWAVDEPLEGQYDFSRYEELIDHAARLDMGVYLGLTCEQAPGWLWRKHPGCRMVRRDGLPVAYEAQTTLPADGKPGPCFDDAGAAADQHRFITVLVRTLGRYENVVVWNTWQEIGYWGAAFAGGDVCYCENTLGHFRRWLGEKYGDLDGLNRAWNTRYGAWSLVLPDRCPAKLPLAQDVDWHYFMDNVQVSAVLRGRAEAIRAADPLQRPVFAHKGSPTFGSGADWTYARCQDFLGSSCYPAWGVYHQWDDGAPAAGKRPERRASLLAEAARVAFTYDYIRSCNRPGAPVWAAEFQGGPASSNGLHKGRVPSPEDIRRWMLTAAASGVTAISFWVTRAEIMAPEMNGFSLLDSSGDSTARYEEAARVGKALNAHADLFASPSWGSAEVGILINEGNHAFCSSMTGGEHLGYAVRGWHRLLWDAGIAADFVDLDHAHAATLAGYRVLVLPFPISLSEGVAARLGDYVRGGGALISEACPGRLDEHAYCPRGEMSPAMAALFGVAQESAGIVCEPDGGARWTPAERTWGEFADAALLQGTGPLAGCSLRANGYLETFVCEEATPVLMHGEAVAGVQRRVGQGQAWLLGTFVGHGGTAYRDEATHQAVERLLAECGVRPARRGSLTVQRRTMPGKEAWLFTNHEEHDITEGVDVGGWSRVSDLLCEPLAREGDRVSLTVKGLDVRVLVLEGSNE
ncbi:MAG: beta-galactosidase [Anaerolineae bacterium]